MNRGVAQIAAITAAASKNYETLVSHPMQPGVDPCWICFELNCQEEDEAWPNIASQLLGREKTYDSVGSRLEVAARVVAKSLDFLDWKNGFSPAGYNSISTKAPLWPFNDGCGCRLTA